MSVNITVNPFDLSVETPVSNSSFRPQVFGVPTGSYAGANYGAGATVTGNWNTVTIRNSTNSRVSSICDIRRQDTEVNFELNVSIDTSLANPGTIGATDQLRVNVLPLLANEPPRYLNPLPPVDVQHANPKFLEGELITLTTTTGVSTQIPIGARLLPNGTLALLTSAGAALTVTDFTTVAPFTTSNTVGIIVIRGAYDASFSG